MKKKNTFITLGLLLLMIVTGCLSNRFIYADDTTAVNRNLTIKVEFAENEDVEGRLVFDIYKVANFSWHGDSASYLIDADDTDTKFAGIFEPGKNVGIRIPQEDDPEPAEYTFFDENLNYDVLNQKASDALGKIYDDITISKAGTVRNGQSITLPVNAIYLAVARSAEADTKEKYLIKDNNGGTPLYRSFAYSAHNQYTFMPYLIFFNELNPENGIDLNKDVVFNGKTVVVKFETSDRLGDFRVDKKLSSICYKDDKPVKAMFAYRIEWFKDQGMTVKQGERIVSIFAPECESVLLEKIIPVGSYVKVTEFYCGPGYELDCDMTLSPDDPVYIPETSEDGTQQDILHVEFINKASVPEDHGYGYDNHFVLQEDKTWKEVNQEAQ